LPITFDDDDGRIDIEDARDFALSAFRVFQELAKQAYENHDENTFKILLDQIRNLFDHFTEDPYDIDLNLIRAQINQQQDVATREKLERDLAKRAKIADVRKHINLAREEVIFGLSSYLLDKYLQDKTGETKQFYELIATRLPNTLGRLTEVFESSTDIKTADFWGWNRWEIIDDGKAHFVETGSKQNRLYCMHSLRLLAKTPADQIGRIQLPPVDAVRMLAGKLDTGDILSSIIAPDANVISPDEAAQLDAFKALLQDAKERADEIDREELIKAQVDPDKLENFVRDVLSAWRENSRLRSIFERENVYFVSTESPRTKISSLGFNQLDDKGPFIANPKVGYVGWGQTYGRGLGQAEDREGFDFLLREAGTKINISRKRLYVAIQEALERHPIKHPLVLHSMLSSFDTGEKSESNIFIPKYQQNCPKTEISDLAGFSGVLKLGDKTIPVVSMYVGSQAKRKVVLVDLNRFARWTQYPPADEPSEERFVTNMILIRVKDLNRRHKLRDQIIAKDPEWLRAEEDKARYLKSRVVVNVYEKFKLDTIDVNAGVTFEVDEEV
jgi:hypothetical protein